MLDKLGAATPKTEKRIFKSYDKMVTKYENNEPLNVRLQKSKELKKEKAVLEKKTGAANKLQGAFKRYRNSKKTYIVTVLLFSPTPATPKQKPYKGVYLIKEAQYEVKAPQRFPEELVRVLVKVYEDRKLYMRGFNILLTDESFTDFIDNQQSSGMCAFKFLDYVTLKDDGKK